MTRSRSRRPQVVEALEDRVILSLSIPAVNPAALDAGPQFRPVVVAAVAGSDHARTITRSGQPDRGQLTFSVQKVAESTTSRPGQLVATYKLDYHNESTQAITSATILDKLGTKVDEVPGGEHVPAGGEFTIGFDKDNDETVELKLPGGIAPGAEGYLEFNATPVVDVGHA